MPIPVTVVSEPSQSALRIRRAVPDDAAAIVSVLATVAAERVHSALDRVWTVEQERSYLELLSPREVIYVAVNERSEIVGLQILDRWSSLESMAHVGQVGTFLLPAQRGRGVGHQLWNATASFAREAGYRKLAIQVRGTNTRARRRGLDGAFRLTSAGGSVHRHKRAEGLRRLLTKDVPTNSLLARSSRCVKTRR